MELHRPCSIVLSLLLCCYLVSQVSSQSSPDPTDPSPTDSTIDPPTDTPIDPPTDTDSGTDQPNTTGTDVPTTTQSNSSEPTVSTSPDSTSTSTSSPPSTSESTSTGDTPDISQESTVDTNSPSESTVDTNSPSESTETVPSTPANQVSSNVTSTTSASNVTPTVPSSNMTTFSKMTNLTTMSPSSNITYSTPTSNMTTATPSWNMTTTIPSWNITTGTPSWNITTSFPSVNMTTLSNFTTAEPSQVQSTANHSIPESATAQNTIQPTGGEMDTTSAQPTTNDTDPTQPGSTDAVSPGTSSMPSQNGTDVTNEVTGSSSPGSTDETSTADASANTADTTIPGHVTETSTAEETTTTKAPVTTTLSSITTKYPTGPQYTDIATYTLSLEFTEVMCNDSTLQKEVDKKIGSSDVPGYLELQKKKDRSFDARFRAKNLVDSDSDQLKQLLNSTLNVDSECYNFTNNLKEEIGKFAALTNSYCKADYICSPGYICDLTARGPLCLSPCETIQCQNSGACQLVYSADGTTAAVQCSCVDTNDAIYSGRFCEVSKINPERVAAIVGGVLGAVCFVLLVALYCMCYRKKESSGKKYQLSGVYNETYEHGSLDMKNM